MHVSRETTRQTDARLRRVIARADVTILDGTFAFIELPLGRAEMVFDESALAYVRDGAVLSALTRSTDSSRELYRVFCFHFPPRLDNSGFVGWLASQLKARVGTGVFVICGQNTDRGGIFDYWGCPLTVADAVLAEVHRLRSSTLEFPERGIRTLDGVRMRVVHTDSIGVANQDTVLELSETNAVVTAIYSGGGIRAGVLAGVRTGENLIFRYTQVDEAGRIDGGHSRCELIRTADARFRLVEHFQWESRPGNGTNVFEEID